jgi:glycosyltransferase involved in cell wall biosynthesis
LENITAIDSNVTFEIVVVDNNSCDQTKEIVEKYKNKKVQYIFEPSTSFTKARHTGFEHATGDVLVYMDDDVLVREGAFKEIVRVFSEHRDCAVAGGKIVPLFEVEPPTWVLDLQKSFNGLSLYDLGEREMEVHAIPGPLMAIARKAYKQVGGFPPDTVGVETNSAKKTFKKLYIGPGDYGFCLLCREAGYKVWYVPTISLQHVILPVRLTKEFWRSRMVGEGHVAALIRQNMVQFQAKGFAQTKDRLVTLKKMVEHFLRAKVLRMSGSNAPLIPDELWFEYYRSLHAMNAVLKGNPGLASYVWELGKIGVADKDYDAVVAKLPEAYKKLAL